MGAVPFALRLSDVRDRAGAFFLSAILTAVIDASHATPKKNSEMYTFTGAPPSAT